MSEAARFSFSLVAVLLLKTFADRRDHTRRGVAPSLIIQRTAPIEIESSTASRSTAAPPRGCNDMNDDLDERLRWVLAIALGSIIIGGTADLAMDKPVTWLSFHVIFETLM